MAELLPACARSDAPGTEVQGRFAPCRHGIDQLIPYGLHHSLCVVELFEETSQLLWGERRIAHEGKFASKLASARRRRARRGYGGAGWQPSQAGSRLWTFDQRHVAS